MKGVFAALFSFICFPLPLYSAGLRKICKAIAEAKNDEERVKAFGPLQEMITFVQFANDECDYGMGYELGMDLFCYGSHVSLINECIEALGLLHLRDCTLLQPTVFLLVQRCPKVRILRYDYFPACQCMFQ